MTTDRVSAAPLFRALAIVVLIALLLGGALAWPGGSLQPDRSPTVQLD